jgi:multiple sugar transport system substrate-binding protein
LLAYSQRFSEIYKDVEVVWDKRSLQQFADFPIEHLTSQYDLLIIDHPWVGCAAAKGCVLPLEQYLSKEYLTDQLRHSVGDSHLSYNYNDHQWALAIDAATPAASYRADLFEKHEVPIPSTWKEVIELARMGKIAVPGIPIDLLMNFYMFCIANGTEPFLTTNEVTDVETGKAALQTMKQLYSFVDKKMFGYNPIAVAELMTSADEYWYCPFAYCYSNYSRHGYAKNVLHYTDLVQFPSTGKLRSTIGGTGLAVSAFGNHKELAVQFAEQIVSATCQSTLYVEHGGQPGHRSAWVNEKANKLCNEFFTNLLPTMDNGYVRPRYNGYLQFQDHAGDVIQNYLLQGGNEMEVLNKLNDMFKKSFLLN